MGSQKFFVEGDDGVFRRLNDEYTVTIHFKNQKEVDAFITFLKRINDMQMELPGQQDDDTQDLHN